MNTKTTKQAESANTGKAVPATGGKRSRRAVLVDSTSNETATQAEPAQRKRRKPFVL